jgi:hypothetical protein
MLVNLQYAHTERIDELIEIFKLEIANKLSNLETFQESYKQTFNIDTYEELDDSMVKDFIVEYDIESINKWFAVKIYDRTSENEIDNISKEQFKYTAAKMKTIPHLVRGYFHIVGPHGEIVEHVDTEYGFKTEETPVYNHIIGISIDDSSIGIRLTDKEISPFVQDQRLSFNAKHPHSAYNNSDSYAVILVLHIERSAFV